MLVWDLYNINVRQITRHGLCWVTRLVAVFGKQVLQASLGGKGLPGACRSRPNGFLNEFERSLGCILKYLLRTLGVCWFCEMWQRDLGAIRELFEADSNATWASRIRSKAPPNEEKQSKSLAREMNRGNWFWTTLRWKLTILEESETYKLLRAFLEIKFCKRHCSNSTIFLAEGEKKGGTEGLRSLGENFDGFLSQFGMPLCCLLKPLWRYSGVCWHCKPCIGDLDAILEWFEADSKTVSARRIGPRALSNGEKWTWSLAPEVNRKKLILNDPTMKINDFRRTKNVQILLCVFEKQVLQASFLQ